MTCSQSRIRIQLLRTLQSSAILLLLMVLLVILPDSIRAEDDISSDPEKNIELFLTQFCRDCHRDEKAEGKLSLQSLKLAEIDRNVGTWEEILHRVETGSMPPMSAMLQPESGQRSQMVDALREIVEAARRRADEKRPFVIRRLNRREYSNSMQDLLGIDWDPAQNLPLDDALYGFDNVAEGLQLSTLLTEAYLDAARGALERALRTDSQLELRRWHYHLGHPADFPDGSTHFGVLNGNAHMAFGNKTAYIGGPALFTEVFPYPPNRFLYEGRYRLVARLTPHNFPPGAVASLRVDGPRHMIIQRDFAVENDKEITLETTFYYDRSDECLRVELNWTNGHHLSWLVRDNPKKDPYYNYWWLINYKEVDGKRVDFKPQSAPELPFGYFDNVSAELSGPHLESWPPRSTSQWFGNSVEEKEPAEVLQRFLTRCFRRDISSEELQRYVACYDRSRLAGMEPIDAFKSVFTIALTSPEFLFLLPDPDSDQSAEFRSGFELASQLSYFLWSGPPDEILLDLARSEQLNQPDVLREQVVRMLRDPKGAEFKTHFTRQWLRLDKLASVMPEPKLFPMYSESLRDAMRDETLLVMRDVIDNNLPLREWISGDWTYVNEKLADYYGIPGVNGDELRRVSPVPDVRGSLFTHASILTMNSEATRTSPVLRGKWILDCLFHRSPPAPPPNVSSLQPDASAAKTPAEHLRIHKSLPACAACHARIDPFGLVLENYDATGQWRNTELPWEDPASMKNPSEVTAPRTPVSIDAKTELIDGTVLTGPQDLKRYLLQRQHDIALGLVEQLMIYGLGRGLRQADREEARSITEAAASEGYRMQTLIQAVVCSRSFRSRPR